LDLQRTLERVRGKYLAIAVGLYYYPTLNEEPLSPFYRALRRIGPDGRLTDTAFYFDFRDEAHFARLEQLIEQEQHASSNVHVSQADGVSGCSYCTFAYADD